jgi:hypothetical protein
VPPEPSPGERIALSAGQKKLLRKLAAGWYLDGCGPVVAVGPCRQGDRRYAFRLRDGRHLYSLRIDIEGVWRVSIKTEEPINGDE